MAKKRQLQARQNKNGLWELTAAEPVDLDTLEQEIEEGVNVIASANAKVRALRSAPTEAQLDTLEALVAEGKVSPEEAEGAKTGRQVSRLISIYSDGGKERRKRREQLEAEAKRGLTLKKAEAEADDD